MVKIHFAQLFGRKWMVIFQAFIILFGIYIVIQILKKVFGGSWSAETLLIALGVANLTFTVTVVSGLASLKSEYKNLSAQFRCMATDFKKMSGQFSETRFEVKHLSETFKRR